MSSVHRIANKEKIEVIPLGFDLNPFQEDLINKRKKTRDTYNLQEDEIAIAIIGRLAPIKNHELFLDSIKIVNKVSVNKLVFFIVGDGETRSSIEKKVSELKISDEIDIRMTSWIRDIKSFNAGMDIICLTSNNEGTPVSLIEAQACNIPIVTTDVGGIRDIVKDNETGYIVSKNNSELFAEKLLLLTENKNNRQKMSQNGWSFVKTNFHYTRLVDDMEKYYKNQLMNKSN